MATAVKPCPIGFADSTKLTKTILRDFVSRCLSQQERLVIMLCYGEELAFDEVAVVLKTSTDEVKQIHDTIVARVQDQVVPAVASRTKVA